MKAKKLLTLILIISIAIVSCKKDGASNDNGTIDPNNPTNYEDPEGTITANLRNDDGYITLFGGGVKLKINSANNFIGITNSIHDNVLFASVGEIDGLGYVLNIPQSGWSDQIAVIPNNGYIIKFIKEEQDWNPIINDWGEPYYVYKYARVYVVDYILSINYEILGAELKYQDNWNLVTVTTNDVTNITSFGAKSGGNISAITGIDITSRGICWSINKNPTLADNKYECGVGVGDFIGDIIVPYAYTTYYVRAYAITYDRKIFYGNQQSFSTTPAVLPYMQSFESSFGTYKTFNITGDKEWKILQDGSGAYMHGWMNGSCYDNEDWLISSPISITGVEHAKINLKYIGANFNHINEELTILASTNYNGGLPSTATWTRLNSTLVNGSNLNYWYTADISLDNYIGDIVTIAVKYVSNTDNAGTVEIKYINIEEGEALNGNVGEIQTLPYIQSFSSEFGTYITKNVIGDQEWIIDFASAKMSGYSSGTYYNNEDWLISSPIKITGVAHAKMVIEYIGRYFSDINNDITIWASLDYQFNNMPASATWAQIPTSLITSDNWNDFVTTEINLVDYIDQTITIGLKYLSNTTHAGTIEIKSIAVI